MPPLLTIAIILTSIGTLAASWCCSKLLTPEFGQGWNRCSVNFGLSSGFVLLAAVVKEPVRIVALLSHLQEILPDFSSWCLQYTRACPKKFAHASLAL